MQEAPQPMENEAIPQRGYAVKAKAEDGKAATEVELEPMLDPMGIGRVAKVPDDIAVLRTKSLEATAEEAEPIWPVLEGMMEILVEEGEKRKPQVIPSGLAACQIGIHRRVAIIRRNDGTYMRLRNPRIEHPSGVFFNKGEACMSIDGISGTTMRFSRITLEDDENGITVLDMDSDGILPLAVQHEVDHMDGILFTDKLVPEKPQPVKVKQQPDRNAPCPCGKTRDGKPVKYKRCCGRSPKR